MLLIAGLVSAAPLAAEKAALDSCAGAAIDIGGRTLWAELSGTGAVTVVFETGNGADSSVWSDLAAQVRAAGARTFLYDRAGTGRSAPDPRPYAIDNEAEALRSLLSRCGVEGPVVLAAHSYGGFISQLLAARGDRKDAFRIAGLVLVDANIPAFFTGAEVNAILARYRPQYDALRQQAPELAATIIPILEAYPATALRMQKVRLPARLPVIDIYAENSWAETPESAAAMRRAHIAFAAAGRHRESVYAAGSSHQVMHDRPEIVLAAIVKAVARAGR
jgi:pimeloyl-ACP methyl ester carboxylesterase